MQKWGVYYQKNPTFDHTSVRLESLTETHAFVRTVTADSMEKVFHEMQGEIWSPNGEARTLIEMLGLHHTSMSIADVIMDMRSLRCYVCAPWGFVELLPQKALTKNQVIDKILQTLQGQRFADWYNKGKFDAYISDGSASGITKDDIKKSIELEFDLDHD